MREFIANYSKVHKDDTEENFRRYRSQVNEFIGQLDSINSQYLIISVTQEFTSKQKIFVSDSIDKDFSNELNSLLTIFPSNYSDSNRLKILIKILLSFSTSLFIQSTVN